MIFQIALKGREGSWEFCLDKFRPFNAFVMLQIIFSNHRLIKFNMTTAISEACIGRLNENCYLVRGFFLVWEMNRFFAAWRDFPHIYRVFPKRTRVVQSIHGGGNKQEGCRANNFGKMQNTGGIIQGDNSAGHCFVLRGLIPLKFFK